MNGTGRKRLDDDDGRMENAFSAKKSGYGRSFVTLSMRSGVILLVGFVMVVLLVGIVAAGAAGCAGRASGAALGASAARGGSGRGGCAGGAGRAEAPATRRAGNSAPAGGARQPLPAQRADPIAGRLLAFQGHGI